MAAAVAFSVETLREAGFDRVWTEPVTVPRWVRGRESAVMTAPAVQELGMVGLGGSVGTPPEGIEAEVLVVSGAVELEARAAEAPGKIVLFDPPWEGYGSVVKYRGNGAAEAARVGAVAALVRSATGNSLGTPHTGVMSYEDDVPRIPAAALTVEDAGRIHRLARRGVPVRVRLTMDARTEGEVEDANVIADLPGRERPEEIVLLGCHLDSWDVGTGAHDDGAGCAIVVGAAALLERLGLRPRRTVRVVLFAAEELGGDGGDAYLAAHGDEVARHVAALESDSGGFAPDGFSVRAAPELIARLTTMARPLERIGAHRVRAGWAGVDIDPLVELGVPGIAHRTANGPYFDVHHSPADTFDKVDPADLAANVAAVAALTWVLAEEEAPLAAPAGNGRPE
jgi:carboxypeptidase Q